MAFYTYIVASRRNGTLYTGSTEAVLVRVQQHKDRIRAGFTAKYGVHHLVWFEEHQTRDEAFRRERQIKKWRRVWKLELIERSNVEWRDLHEEMMDPLYGLDRTGSPLSRG
jgi:putative endonuclease